MATETQTQDSTVPQITVLTRVASIPLINDSLTTLHSTLSNNAYTRTPYSAAQAIGSRAYRVSEPIQARLAPVIIRADGFANQAIDAIETRYPYPFTTPTGDIYNDLKKNGDYAVDVANKTIDERVKSPAYGFAQGIDSKFTPVVDRFESVVNKVHSSTGQVNGGEVVNGTNGSASSAEPFPSKAQFQYQRAYKLSVDLKDQLYVYTTEQLRQVQEHNVIVLRATATASSITSALSTSYDLAQSRIHALSDKMLSELHKLQSSTAALPAHVQNSLSGLSDGVSITITQLTAVVRSDLPLNEKVAKLRSTVEERVQPLLAGASATVQETLALLNKKTEEIAPTPVTNGNGTVDEEKPQVNGLTS